MWSQWPWVSSTSRTPSALQSSSRRSCSLAASSSTASPVSLAPQHVHVVVHRADHDLVDLGLRVLVVQGLRRHAQQARGGGCRSAFVRIQLEQCWFGLISRRASRSSGRSQHRCAPTSGRVGCPGRSAAPGPRAGGSARREHAHGAARLRRAARRGPRRDASTTRRGRPRVGRRAGSCARPGSWSLLRSQSRSGGRGDAAAERAGAARGARRVRRPRGARRDPGGGERGVQRRPPRADRAPARSSRPSYSGIAGRRSSATRRRRAISLRELSPALERSERRGDREPTARCASAGSRGCSATSATRFRRATTPPTCAGSRRSSRPTRRTARRRSACRRSTALGFDLTAQPNIKLDLDDRPQKSPRACVIASDPPKVVHLITRAQGGLHDYQAFLHEAGHALHYARLRPGAAVHLPPHLARPRADRDLLVHRRGDLARARMARAVLRALAPSRRGRTPRRRRSSRRCSTAATRRSCATSSTSGRGSTTDGGDADVYERLLTEATGIRYRRDNYLSRHGRRLLLGRLPARVDPLGAAAPPPRRRGRRGLVAQPARPASCCASSSARGRSRRARRSPAGIGFDPLDTKPLLHEIGA